MTQTKYDPWLEEIIEAGIAGYIAPEDVQKCIEGYDEARFMAGYNSYENLLEAFSWVNHSYGGSFWNRIDDNLIAYRNNHQKQPFKNSFSMKNTTETIVKYGLIAVGILALILIFAGRAKSQSSIESTGKGYSGYMIDLDNAVCISGGFFVEHFRSKPSATKFHDGCYYELTKYGFEEASTFPTPDTLDAIPIRLSENEYLFQYDDRTHILYARLIYTINDVTWFGPVGLTELGDRGSTYDIAPIIELYYDLGRLDFALFCQREGVAQTPAAKQYHQTCIEFVNFIKSLSK